GTGIAAGGLLVNGHCGGKALDKVHVGLVHLPQELAGVGREGLHIAPLPFRVNGIKGQGRLPGSRQAGDHHQLVPGYFHIYIFQVVLAGTLDDKPIGQTDNPTSVLISLISSRSSAARSRSSSWAARYISSSTSWVRAMTACRLPSRRALCFCFSSATFSSERGCAMSEMPLRMVLGVMPMRSLYSICRRRRRLVSSLA